MDPRPTFQKAIALYRTSQQIRPNYLPPYTNAGIAYWYIAQYEMGKGLDPGRSFQSSIDQYQSVLKRNPKDPFAYFNLSLVYLDAGRHDVRAGRDPSKSFQLCLQSLQKSSEGMTNAYLPSALGSAYGELAQYQVSQDQDPSKTLELSRAALNKSISIDPSNYEPYTFLGRAETIAAQWAIQKGASPVSYFQAAEKALRKSLELNDQEGSTFQVLAILYKTEAEWMQQQKRPAIKSIHNGLRNVDKVLSLTPNDPEALTLQGTFLLLQSQEVKDPSARATSVRQAQSSLQKGLKINPWLEREYGPVLKKANLLLAAN
jgi:tetratricopeptide (TPR) repeat protein